MTHGVAQVSETTQISHKFSMMSARPRPLPRVGDNLDRLLDLLDQAAAVDRALVGRADTLGPYRDLLRQLERTA
jgi:hypothetical protein